MSPRQAPERSSRSQRTISIEYKLPLLITAILVAVVGAYAWATYREVRRSTLDLASERLRRAVEQLAQITEALTRQQTARLRDIARSDVVRAYVSRPEAGLDTAVLAKLQSLVPPETNRVGIELWSAAGARLLTVGSTTLQPDVRLAGELDGLIVEHDSSGPSAVRVFPDSVFASTVVPVASKGARVGYLVRWIRIGVDTGSRRQIEGLLGNNASLYFGHVPTGLVADVTGVPVQYAVDLQGPGATFEAERPGRGRVLAAKRAVVGSPWVLIADVPRDQVLARTWALFDRLAVAALLVVVVGAVGGWLLSRRITRPLRQATDAAEAVAIGDYSRRLDTSRRDELGRLGAAFNVMSEEVADSQQRLRGAMRAAEAGNRAKGEFLATMSHEIRTPLNAILGYADLLEMEIAGPLTVEQRGYLTRVRASGRHLSALISDVLDLSKIEAERLDVRRTTARLDDAVRAALDIVQLQAQARALTISNDCEGHNGCRYAGDEGRVEQILVNLLSNAVKFTAPGGSIDITCGDAERLVPAPPSADGGPWVFVRVQDTGVGIPPDRLEAIWDPFVQVDMALTRSHGGTGLGLAICRRLARLMGGDVTVQSEVGVGSSFVLWLPAAPADDGAAGGGERSAALTASGGR